MNDGICPWPRCHAPIPGQRFMCRQHWYQLPPAFRAGILAAYTPGQTVDTASADYWAARADALEWARHASAQAPGPA